jgi:hypothetical protein
MLLFIIDYIITLVYSMLYGETYHNCADRKTLLIRAITRIGRNTTPTINKFLIDESNNHSVLMRRYGVGSADLGAILAGNNIKYPARSYLEVSNAAPKIQSNLLLLYNKHDFDGLLRKKTPDPVFEIGVYKKIVGKVTSVTEEYVDNIKRKLFPIVFNQYGWEAERRRV